MRLTNNLALVCLLGTVAVTLGACAADNGVDDPTVMIDPETDTISPMAPLNPCPKRPTMPVDGPLGTTGAANVADGCDWFIVSGTLSQTQNHFARVDMTSLGDQRIIVQTQALCESSWVEAEVYGERGPYYTYDPGPVYHPAINEWVLLGTQREHGTWYAGKCRFAKAEQQCGIGSGSGCQIAIYNIPGHANYNAMETLLIATRSRIYGSLGPTTAKMQGYKY